MQKAAAQPRDLWSLVLDSITIDPGGLLSAVVSESEHPQPDFRTRLLMRDAYVAVQGRYGSTRLSTMLRRDSIDFVDHLLDESFGESGFPTLGRRLADHTRLDDIESMFRELGRNACDPCRVDVGGSVGLMLAGLLQRRTDDIELVDFVDEVPAALRRQHAALDALVDRYQLRLTHFQSHYLPSGWQHRFHSYGVYGPLTVYIVDATDILTGKMFSRRTKDLDDMRLVRGSIGREQLSDRLRSSGGDLASDPGFRANAEKNWDILFGETLPI